MISDPTTSSNSDIGGTKPVDVREVVFSQDYGALRVLFRDLLSVISGRSPAECPGDYFPAYYGEFCSIIQLPQPNPQLRLVHISERTASGMSRRYLKIIL